MLGVTGVLARQNGGSPVNVINVAVADTLLLCMGSLFRWVFCVLCKIRYCFISCFRPSHLNIFRLPLPRLASREQCKCSYQKGNLFLSFVVTVFLAPSQASGQLLEPYDENELVLVEVQLMEGDGLYFSGLFRDLVDIINVREKSRRTTFTRLTQCNVLFFASFFCRVWYR